MSDQPNADQPNAEEPIEETELPDSFHRNRRQHGGAPQRLDDDQLARLTEEEREEAGVPEDDAGDADEA